MQERQVTQHGDEPTEVKQEADGSVVKIYEDRRIRETADGNLLSQYIFTTPGRMGAA